MRSIILALLVTLPLNGEEVVDRIVAIVGDETILQSELEEQVRFYLSQLPQPLNEEELRKKALQDLINNKIIYLEAKKDTSIVVTQEEIEEYVDNQIQLIKRQMGKEELKNWLEKMGLTEEKLRERYRKLVKEYLYVQKYIDQKIKPKVSITPNEVYEYYVENKDSIPKRPTLVRISHILVKIRPEESREEEARKKAEKIYEMLMKGASFAEMASRYSDDRETAEMGGEIGYLRRTDLPDTLAQKIFQLEPGEISKPIRGEIGYHIFRCLEKENETMRLSHIMIKVRPSKRDTEKALTKVQDILARIKKGESFSELARTYSDDLSSKDLGGDIGWTPLYQLPEEIKKAVGNMKIGEIKGPVETELGYHIIKLDERKEGGTPTYEEVKDELTQFLIQKKIEKEIKKLVDRLKKKIYVEIRL